MSSAPRRRRLRAAMAAFCVMALAGCDTGADPAPTGPTAASSSSQTTTSTSIATESSSSPTPAPTATKSAPPDNGTVIVAAGDIACAPDHPAFRGGAGTPTACRQQATSDLVAKVKPAAVFPLGDIQYERARTAEFRASYDKSWGRFKEITWPVAGNHEYGTGVATDYFRYFGKRAAKERDGYYSTDIGGWHVVVLNSTCSLVGGCHKGSAQEKWLRADLAKHRTACTLALWHHPRWSSGLHGNDASMDGVWRTLVESHVEVALTGHDHDYERFAPLNADGQVDPAHGLRQLVVGTGGRNLYFFKGRERGSEVRDWQTFGVLKMTLRARSYEWEFVPVEGETFSDSGSGSCH